MDVASFVNTADLHAGTDALADVAGLERWASEHGFGGGFDEAGRERVVAFREGLRLLLLGRPSNLEATQLTVSFDRDGTARLDAADDGAAGLIGALTAVVVRAQADGTWSRMKACAAEDCHWAFYDRSRNRSRTWCSMRECGNRAKARSYRARQR
jgi:hypothetical protein